MTKPIKILTAVFDIPIRTREVRNFRAAINEVYFSHEEVFKKSGLSAGLFMNRDENSEFKKNLYDFPLIQYQQMAKEGFKAAITGIGIGAQAIVQLLKYKPATITFNGHTFDFNLLHEIEQDYKPALIKKDEYYRINYWLPLNPQNHTRWKNSAGFHGRVTLLNKCLAGHVKSFLKRIAFDEDRGKVVVKLHDIEKKHNGIALHGQTLICYSAIFRSNVLLPDNIGIGIGPAFGFGRIKRIGGNR